MKSKRFIHLTIIILVGSVAAAIFLLWESQTKSASYPSKLPNNDIQNTKTNNTLVDQETKTFKSFQSDRNEADVVSVPLPDRVLLQVPFTTQAPFGEWSDPRQDYGCEEASSLMAWHWLNNEPLSLQQAKEEIIAMSNWELETYGDFHDRSSFDTAKMFKEYFGYENVRLVYDIIIDDIKTELAKGNILIVPVNGQKLENPHYTPPGPIQHMIVIRGYDNKKQEFITNDPGTKRGDGIRFSYKNLIESLQDYKTGFNEPIDEIKSAMIIIENNLNL